jgi:phenylacetate-CoA ligase
MSRTAALPRRVAFISKPLAAGSLSQRVFKFLREKKSSFWIKEIERQCVKLFGVVANKVPAYKRFLSDQHVDPREIKGMKDFQTLPAVNKDSYLRRYPLEELCTDGTLAQPLTFTSTSGSTGQPFYFPRNGMLEEQSSISHEWFLRTAQIDPNKSTLVLICFGMGVWIGGVITYQAFKRISERGYALTLLTPGVNKKEIFDALKNIGKKFDQVILCGYPPFMKDVIDEAASHQVDWRDYNLRVIFAAETFSERFRDYIVEKTGIADVYRHTMNIYGSADLGTMAQETPLSILIRRLALKNKQVYSALFGQESRLPTLAQFNPLFIDFEAVDGKIYCTGNSALPLIRYEIGDNGNVTSFAEIEEIFKHEGINLRAEAKKVGIADTVTELPFVHVYERTDLSTKLYGAIIYPEYIKAALHDSLIEKYITGKFTMHTEHDDHQDEYLEINVELKPGINESEWLLKEVTKVISASLLKHSAEHKNNAHMMPGKVEPRVIFWPHNHPRHFQAGIKQRWVAR